MMTFTRTGENPSTIFTADEKYTFLVGAGISMDPPSNLPSARALVRNILEISVPAEEVDSLLSIENLRYEQVVQMVYSGYDKSLQLMSYFDKATEPNALHYFLGRAILAGAFVMTTNFDHLLEHALMRLVPDEQHSAIVPVITQTDFKNDPLQLVKEGKHPVFKLHGSWRNVVTNEELKTTTLITKISDLGVSKGAGQTFGLEEFKKPAVDAIVKGHTLVIMGYSGGDDFDIGPFLSSIHGTPRIIWIDHVPRKGVQPVIEVLSESKVPVHPPAQEMTRLDAMLRDIFTKNQEGIQIYRVFANTIEFIDDVFRPAVFPSMPAARKDAETRSKQVVPVPFSEFIKPFFTKNSSLARYAAACSVYSDLSQIELLERCARRGLDLAIKENNPQAQGYLFNFMASYYHSRGMLREALRFLEDALPLCDKLQATDAKRAQVMKEMLLSNIGTIHKSLGDRAKALACFEEACTLSDQSGNIAWHPGSLLNLAMLLLDMGEIDKAERYLKETMDIVKLSGDMVIKTRGIMGLASMSEKRGNNAQAIQYYKEALEVSQKLGSKEQTLNINRSIGSIYLDLKDFDEALKHFNAALAVADQLRNNLMKSRTLDMVARVYQAMDRFTDAEAFFKKSIEVNPDNGIAVTDLGTLYTDAGKLDDAEVALEKAAEMRKKDGVPLAKLGLVFLRKKDITRAEGCVLDALKRDPEDELVLYFVSRVQAACGKDSLAIENLGKLLKKDTSYKKVILETTEFKRLMGDPRFDALF